MYFNAQALKIFLKFELVKLYFSTFSPDFIRINDAAKMIHNFELWSVIFRLLAFRIYPIAVITTLKHK